MSLQEAYLAWSETKAGVCLCLDHAKEKWQETGEYLVIPHPDVSVCPREKRWRRYTEIRDGKTKGYYSQMHVIRAWSNRGLNGKERDSHLKLIKPT
jgi:hypothetical protein